jgi:hypothetical protein
MLISVRVKGVEGAGRCVLGGEEGGRGIASGEEMLNLSIQKMW